MTFFAVAAAAAFGGVPQIRLNNGVEMPVMSLGTWRLNGSEAFASVATGLGLGFTHIDAAWNYHNQADVGRALKGRARSSYFLTTKVPDCSHYFNASVCARPHAKTAALLEFDLARLGVQHVDLLLLHFPPKPFNCTAMQAEYRAIEEFYAAGKARAIGVSNFCPSSLRCLLQTAKVVPAVNQIQYHVGMGVDAGGIRTLCAIHGITVQAYSPLGAGTEELITGKLVTSIGREHKKTGAQVSLRYLYQLGNLATGRGGAPPSVSGGGAPPSFNGMPFSTRSTNAAHLQQALEVFSDGFSLGPVDILRLELAKTPRSNYSFMCTK